MIGLLKKFHVVDLTRAALIEAGHADAAGAGGPKHRVDVVLHGRSAIAQADGAGLRCLALLEDGQEGLPSHLPAQRATTFALLNAALGEGDGDGMGLALWPAGQREANVALAVEPDGAGVGGNGVAGMVGDHQRIPEKEDRIFSSDISGRPETTNGCQMAMGTSQAIASR